MGFRVSPDSFYFLHQERMKEKTMNTQTDVTCSNTSGKLLSMITAHIEELAHATDAAKISKEMLRYLDVVSKFHRYSLCNLWLIMMNKPNATSVAGFRKWQSLNRYVKKGEHGIPILAPMLVKRNVDINAQEEIVGFKVVYVFDVSQTEGEALPPPPNWKSPEKNGELTEGLIQYANRLGISVVEKELQGEVQGVSKGGSIELSTTAGTVTLIHEIAHELLHHQEDHSVSKEVRELEAEAVAFVVARHFGLDGMSCPNYIALHGALSSDILDQLDRIKTTTAEIIEAIQEDQQFQD
jgi:hypothetical protein